MQRSIKRPKSSKVDHKEIQQQECPAHSWRIRRKEKFGKNRRLNKIKSKQN